MLTRNAEVIAGLVLVAFSVFAWREASGIRPAAAMFPSLIIMALGFFSVVYLVRSVLAGGATPPVFARGWVFVVVMALTLLYVNAVVRIGYVTSTLVFIPLLAWVIGFRRPVYIAVTTLVYLACVYVLFELLFGRPLPSEALLEFLRRLR